MCDVTEVGGDRVVVRTKNRDTLRDLVSSSEDSQLPYEINGGESVTVLRDVAEKYGLVTPSNYLA